MAKVPAAAIAAGGLVGGYGVARWTKKRPLGGVTLAAAGAVAAREWKQAAGTKAAVGLTAAYVAAFAGSHPWPRRSAPGRPCSLWRVGLPWPPGPSPGKMPSREREPFERGERLVRT